MHYYPDGDSPYNADWISMYLFLDHTDGNEVKAQFNISLVADQQHGESYGKTTSRFYAFTVTRPWGFGRFITAKDLEESVYLKDDVFRVRCDVTVTKEIVAELTTPPAVVVPPSDMHHHLARLLSSGEGCDVAFEVGGETFPAHRYILAARSAIFRAELLSPMKENAAARVRIDDMDPKAFRAMLHFVYTDSLAEGSTVAMAQDLLVAADRYDMKRLKLICEKKLCNNLCRSTVANTLALAEQHGCGALKKACFKFLTSPGNLKAVTACESFHDLRRSCPSVLEELIAMLAP
jgi:speckle-type POZ protein